MARQYIWVTSGLTGRNARRVALYERHVDHPGGAAVVAGGGDVLVAANTPQVARAIFEGRIKLVRQATDAEVEGHAGDVPAAEAASAGDSGGLQSVTTAQSIVDVVGMPRAQKLAEAGYDTPEKIQAATAEELIAVDDIGKATVTQLDEAFGIKSSGDGAPVTSGDGEPAGGGDDGKSQEPATE